MSFVVDASAAASWFLPDEQSDADERLIAALGISPGLVPSLFWFETATSSLWPNGAVG